jgi:DNA-binding NarL/FixJ family response regulator
LRRTRVLLADDHPVLVAGLVKLLEEEFDVVGTASDGLELVSAAQRLQPDAAVIDISMPKLNGIDAIRRIRKASPSSKLVVLSVHSDAAYVREARLAGAHGYVQKQSAWGDLLEALRRVLSGGAFIPAGFPTNGSRPCDLTLRQREVLRLIAEGWHNKEIAAFLHISLKTVEYHRARIMNTLDIHSSPGLTRYAIRHGVVAEN